MWLDPTAPGKPVDVRLSPQERESFATFLEAEGLEHGVFIADVQR